MRGSKNQVYIIWGMIILIFASIIYWGNSHSSSIDNIKLMGGICIFNLLYMYYSWYKCQGSFLNGYIIFVSAFYVFNLGQPMLKVFDVVDTYYDLLDTSHFLQISYASYFRSTYVGIVSIIAMHIGALIALSHKNIVNTESVEKSENVRKKILSIKRVSLLLVIFSFPFWFYETYKLSTFTLAYGYGGEMYTVKTEIPGYVRVLSNYYEPALLCLYFCSEYLKKDKLLTLLAIILTVVVPPLIIGGRSQAVIALSMVAIVYYLFHKLAVKKILILGVSVYLGLIVLFVVKKTRNSVGNTLETYSELLSSYESSPIFSTISEMGHSMYPLAATMDLVPASEDYRYGTSYLWGLTTLVPNIGFGERHPGVVNANLGEWLMKKEGLQFGPGYSLTAEAYINFGYFGFIFFFIYGYLLAKYCRFINKRYIYEKPFMIIITLVFLWFSIKTVRNSFIGTIRALFYVSIPMYWAFRYYYNKHFRKHAIA